MKQRKKSATHLIPKEKEIICRCNQVPRSEIEKAILEKGAVTMNQIFDLTTAGVGPCGGTCRKKMAVILNQLKPKK